MKFFVILSVVLLSGVFAADEPKKSEDGIKIYKRLIPADVLRGKLLFILIEQFFCYEQFT